MSQRLYQPPFRFWDGFRLATGTSTPASSAMSGAPNETAACTP